MDSELRELTKWEKRSFARKLCCEEMGESLEDWLRIRFSWGHTDASVWEELRALVSTVPTVWTVTEWRRDLGYKRQSVSGH